MLKALVTYIKRILINKFMGSKKKKQTAAARSRKRDEYKDLFKEIPAKSQRRDKSRANKKTLEKPGAHANINRRYLQTHDLNRVDTKQISSEPAKKKRAPRKVAAKKKSEVPAPPSEDVPPIPRASPKRKEKSGISLIERALMGPKKKKKLQSLTDYQRERGLPVYGK